LKKYILALTAAGLSAIAPLQVADARQQDPNLTIFMYSTYTLAINEKCQVANAMQAVTLEKLKLQARRYLVSRLAASDVDAEDARLTDAAHDAWDGCLTRADSPAELANVDQALLMADAMLAAPGTMPAEVTSCGIDTGDYKVSRTNMDAVRAMVDAKYEGSPLKATYEQYIAGTVDAITQNCTTVGYDPLISGISRYAGRLSLREKQASGEKTSLDNFGEWTAYKYFGRTDLDEFGVDAYRSGSETGNVATFGLSSPSMMGNHARVVIGKDGSWRVSISGWPDAFEIRSADMQPIALTMVEKTGDSEFFGNSVFALDAATGASLLALDPETRLSFVQKPSGGRPWMGYKTSTSDSGYLKAASLQAAVAWASAPVSPELDDYLPPR